MRKAGQRMTASTDDARTMSFPNFLTRQSLRDEAMASASAAWLAVISEHLLAKCGFDTAENEPCKVCPISAYSIIKAV